MPHLLSCPLLPLLLAFSVTPLATTSPSKQCTTTTTDQVRAGYWLSHTSPYAPLSNISTSLYTHLYYYSLLISEADFKIDSPPSEQLPLLAAFSPILKTYNPLLKTLLSIGGDRSNSSTFSLMAGNATRRAEFINSTIAFARAYAFDGLDLAWQFPSSMSDMENLGLLLTEWRARISEDCKDLEPLLLTATVYFSGHVFKGSANGLDYPIDAISNSVDWTNALCFNYHNSSSAATAADAALYDTATHLSTSYGITSWLDAGLPPHKLVMGIPLYGRSWFLKNKQKNVIGAPAVAAGPRRKLSNQTGLMAYFEIEGLLAQKNVGLGYDNGMVSAYLYTGDLWVSFDSPEVVDTKVEFASHNKLLGYFLWPVSYDDSNHTISTKALDSWLRYHTSGDTEDKNGSEQAQAPTEDITPIQPAAFASSTRSLSTIHCLTSNCFLFLFLSFLTYL